MKILKLFLRLGVSAGFLSAVADRLGYWPANISVWGNWESFLSYTELINPMVPKSWIPGLGILATAAELILGICLLIGLNTEMTANSVGS